MKSVKSVKINQVYELRTTGEIVKVIKECNGYYLAVEYDYSKDAWSSERLMVLQ